MKTQELRRIMQAQIDRSGLTHEQIAKRMGTQRTAISRLLRYPERTKLSTLSKFAKAVGKVLWISFE